MRIGRWVQITWGVGAYPSPTLAQTWKNGKNYNYLEKLAIDTRRV